MAAYNSNVARVQVVGRLDGQDVVNVLHFDEDGSVAGGWTLERLDQLIAATASAWNVQIKTFLSQGYTLERITAYHLSGPGGVVSEQVITGVQGSLVGSSQLPNNVAICASILTGRAGRSFRGRTYFSGLVDDQVTLNEVVSGWVADINTALAAVLGVYATEGFRLGVYSTQSAGAERVAGVFTPATSWVLRDATIDSRRTRLPGRGR